MCMTVHLQCECLSDYFKFTPLVTELFALDISSILLSVVMVPFFAYIAGADYGHVLTTLHFRPNHSVSTVVQVKILDDVLQEGEEKFTVELTAFDLSVVLVTSITEIFIDDDDRGKFQFTYCTQRKNITLSFLKNCQCCMYSTCKKRLVLLDIRIYL